MAQTKQKQKEGFTPTGVYYPTSLVPEPTPKSHKDLKIKDKELLELLESMQRQRRFEERAVQMYQKGKFGGFLHVYIGQEAVSTGANFALRPEDDIITAYRDHGMGLVRGVSSKSGMAELYGKATGCSRGKGGSMHFFNVEERMWGGHGIVGAHIPMGTGLAMANKYKGRDTISATFFGDGAVDQGALHESLNLASLWKLPALYIIENNGYSMGTAAGRHSYGELVNRAMPFDMEARVVNGMEVLSVIEQVREAAEDIRKNHHPWLLEVRTYRYRGHSMSDPANYRSKEEEKEYREQFDPIKQLRDYIIDNGIFNEKKVDELYQRIEDEINEAVEYAENSSYPELDELYEDVYTPDYDFPFLK